MVPQHDVFRPDGTPHRRGEVEIIRTLTGGKQALSPTQPCGP
jgi:hypothetical protein